MRNTNTLTSGGLEPASTSTTPQSSGDPSTSANSTPRYQLTVHGIGGVDSGSPIVTAAETIRATWEGRISADDYELAIERFDDSDE